MTTAEILAIIEKEGLDEVLARGDSVKIGTRVLDRIDVARLRREPIAAGPVMTNNPKKATAPKAPAPEKAQKAPKDELERLSHEELGAQLKAMGQAVPSKRVDRLAALRALKAGKAPEDVPGDPPTGGE